VRVSSQWRSQRSTVQPSPVRRAALSDSEAGLTPRARSCQTVLLYWLRELKKEVTE
jgi:hypothetical protein